MHTDKKQPEQAKAWTGFVVIQAVSEPEPVQIHVVFIDLPVQCPPRHMHAFRCLSDIPLFFIKNAAQLLQEQLAAAVFRIGDPAGRTAGCRGI